MKSLGFVTVAFCLAAEALICAPSANDATRVPVLLELFTSEGCSNCPPAHALLAKLDAQ